MKQFILSLAVLTLAAFGLQAANAPKVYSVKSPDGKVEMQISVGETVTYAISFDGQQIVDPSPVSMTAEDGTVFVAGEKVASAKTSSVDNTLITPLGRQSQIREAYNQIDIRFKSGFGLQARAYNEGAAYRFYSNIKKPLTIKSEQAEILFSHNFRSYVAYSGGTRSKYNTSFENLYAVDPVSKFSEEKIAYSPLLVAFKGGKMAITESNLEAYPGMFLQKNGEKGLKGDFAPYPKEVYQEPSRCQELVRKYSDFIAQVEGPRSFPWRCFLFAAEDKDLLTNNLVWLLADDNRIGDLSWIKPGKVAWDWWNNWGITGVDFVAGINNDTYKYYIDFAAANGIEYVVLDEGWSEPKSGDIMLVIPDIDLEELVSYGKAKGVDIILWAVAAVIDAKLEEACSTYSEMGVKGFKIDFMDRDDQATVERLYRIAETAAKYHMIVDYHGMYKPAGMNRTFPNVINFEGIWGLENLKWSKDGDMVNNDVTFPYIRMTAGPVDYTQGAMRNSTKQAYAPNYDNPVSQGTRAHQVATYAVFDSPLVMLCDNPTAYMKEQETTDYIVRFPTVWDQTVALGGRVGESVMTARRSGDTWYVGCLNNWDPRDFEVDLSFLGEGSWNAEIFRDGLNAARSPQDYKIEKRTVHASDVLNIHCVPGGGFAIILTK